MGQHEDNGHLLKSHLLTLWIFSVSEEPDTGTQVVQ